MRAWSSCRKKTTLLPDFKRTRLHACIHTLHSHALTQSPHTTMHMHN